MFVSLQGKAARPLRSLSIVYDHGVLQIARAMILGCLSPRLDGAILSFSREGRRMRQVRHEGLHAIPLHDHARQSPEGMGIPRTPAERRALNRIHIVPTDTVLCLEAAAGFGR